MVGKTQLIVRLYDALALIEDASTAHTITEPNRLAIIRALAAEAKREVDVNPSNGGPIDE